MKLEKITTIRGEIRLISGLHIGAGGGTMEIGGLDQPIIKHPLTGEPYIPGSSIKGKLRSLLEFNEGKFASKGKPCGCCQADCKICRMFGPHSTGERQFRGPSRLLVRDGYLTQFWKDKFNDGELPMEIKYENTIQRITGVADNPRPLERVPAGVVFDCNMSLRVFDEDEDMDLERFLLQGLILMEIDALGGCGSRGCGQIAFQELAINGQPAEEKWRTAHEALFSQGV